MTTALFLLDMAMDMLAVLIALRMDGRRITLLRVALAAGFGAGAAEAVRSLPLTRGMAAALWLPIAAAMMAAAGGLRMLRRPVRSAALLFGAMGMLGGVVQALRGATGSLAAAYLLGVLSAAAIAANAIRANADRQDTSVVRVRCRYRGQNAEFEAMIDSGNTLRDYLTHAPVIVLPEEMGRKLFALEGAVLRPIFAYTAGGRQMMRCFSLEETEILTTGGALHVHAAAALAHGLEGQVLVPASLLRGERS